MKLETKHLAPYLPYNLKMVMTHDSFEDFENIDSDEDCLLKGSIWELYVLTTDYIDFFGGECDDFAVKEERYRIANNGTLKPILRPLSDISKEIEVDGEKFIPIFELAKISNFKHDFKRIVNENGTLVLYSDVSKHPELDHPGLVHFFEMDTEDCDFDYGFESLGQDGEVFDTFFFPIKNQLSLFNKLFEWHFDVFGLIEKDLAININTL
jgi:hypothetical protein